MVIIAPGRFADVRENLQAQGGKMTTLLSGLMLVVVVFGSVTIAGCLIWFWKNRHRLPRRHHSEEYELHQKDYYLNHQAEYRRSQVPHDPDKIDRAA